MLAMPEMRELLRGLKSLPGPYQRFDLALAPAQPEALFAQWLQAAIDAGIREPHAMTLSTVDEHGHPDARVLILKNVDEQGWHFAITRSSPKGRQVGKAPHVALTFYWPVLGRQVRIRGVASDMGPEAQASDFLARPAGSRAAGLLGRQSDVLGSDDELDRGLAEQRRRLERDPGLVAPQWAVYAVRPTAIEFWQGDEQRRHVRLRYVRDESGWTTERLWP
jgi:pyridoxamine 5'-phosphate oxidase